MGCEVTMDNITCQRELYEISREYRETCELYKQAKQVYKRMEDLKATKLAKMEIKHTTPTRTQAEIKRYALADEEYAEFIESISKARDCFVDAEAKIEAYKNRKDALITLISFEKEKMKMI